MVTKENNNKAQATYNEWLFNSNKNYIRSLLLFFVVVFSLYIFIDHKSVDHSFTEILIIRLGFGILPLLFSIYTSFRPRLYKYFRFIIPTSIFIMNLGSSAIYSLFDINDKAFPTLHSGILLAIIALALSMSEIKLVGTYIILSCAMYASISIFKHDLYAQDPLLFIRITTPLIVASAFGITISIIIEKFSKKLYNAQLNIIKEKDDLKDERNKFVQLNEDKNKFFSIISHDLRSPFNILIGYFVLLLRNENPQIEVERSDIQKIYLHIRRTFNLLNNLLSWSNTQMNRYIFEPKQYSLEEIMFDNQSLFQEIAFEKNITLEYFVDNKKMIFCDKDMITSVIRNLIFNAIKFTQPNGTIQIEAIHAPGSMIQISVIDQGAGIEEDVLDIILRKKQQFSTKGTSQEEGSGIGLLLCHEFLEKHHTELQIISKINEGSKFYFLLPQYRT